MEWIIAIAALCGTPTIANNGRGYFPDEILKCQQYYIKCTTPYPAYANAQVLAKCVEKRKL